MKKILISIMLLLAISCATWKAMTPAQKVDAAIGYYQTFAIGVEQALPWVAAYFPAAAPIIQSQILPLMVQVDTAIAGLRSVAELYLASKASELDFLRAGSVVQELLEQVSRLIGQVKGVAA